jgi:hypothetical protein
LTASESSLEQAPVRSRGTALIYSEYLGRKASAVGGRSFSKLLMSVVRFSVISFKMPPVSTAIIGTSCSSYMGRRIVVQKRLTEARDHSALSTVPQTSFRPTRDRDTPHPLLRRQRASERKAREPRWCEARGKE